jgi:replicative DNA helicase
MVKRTEKKKVDLQTILFGKVPPNSKELECAILGSILNNHKLIIDANQYLTPNDFYLLENKIVFESILKIYNSGNIIESVLVLTDLNDNNKLEDIGGAFYLSKLISSTDFNAVNNFKKYCLIVKEKSVQRRLINFGAEVLNRAGEPNENVFDLLGDVDRELKGINTTLSEINYIPLSDIVLENTNDLRQQVHNDRNDIFDENKILTGLKGWDIANGKLFNGLYVIAGRPGMGKGVHLTEMICRMGKIYNIGVINGEMTNKQLIRRVACNLGDIDNYLFRKNGKHVSDEELELYDDANNEALQLKLHLYDNKSIDKIASKIRYWVEKNNVKCIMADFLTLFRVPPEMARYMNKTEQVDYILNVFCDLCKELNIPIILYVQMNRQIMGRQGNKEPNLSDLKASGSIEELAFQVSFLHRPEYYDPNATIDEMGESTKGLMYQIIVKSREGKAYERIKYQAKLESSKLNEITETALIDFNAIKEQIKQKGLSTEQISVFD